jgi:hypothetical protein
LNVIIINGLLFIKYFTKLHELKNKDSGSGIAGGDGGKGDDNKKKMMVKIVGCYYYKGITIHKIFYKTS